MTVRNVKLEAHVGLYCSPGYKLSNDHLSTVICSRYFFPQLAGFDVHRAVYPFLELSVILMNFVSNLSNLSVISNL